MINLQEAVFAVVAGNEVRVTLPPVWLEAEWGTPREFRWTPETGWGEVEERPFLGYYLDYLVQVCRVLDQHKVPNVLADSVIFSGERTSWDGFQDDSNLEIWTSEPDFEVVIKQLPST